MWDQAGRPLTAEELPSRRALRGKRESKLLRYRSHDGQLDRMGLAGGGAPIPTIAAASSASSTSSTT